MDTEAQQSLSRRRLVQGLAVAAGTVGITAANRFPASADEDPRSGRKHKFTLTGVDWRAVTLGVAAGVRPGAGTAPTTVGRIADGGVVIGDFSSASVPGSGGHFTLHSFRLGDGTLLGMGTGPLSGGSFAVVGGTGRFQGARGGYTADERPSNLGGDGTALFVFDLTPQEG